MSRRAPNYGLMTALIINMRRFRRRFGLRPAASSGPGLIGFIGRFIGLWFLMVGGAIFAFALSFIFGGMSTFFLVLSGVAIGAGFWFIAGMSGPRRRSTPKVTPPPIAAPSVKSTDAIRLAKRLGGELTVNQTALELGVEYSVSEGLLDELHRMGSCQIVVDEQGVLVYRFPEFVAATAVDQDGA